MSGSSIHRSIDLRVPLVSASDPKKSFTFVANRSDRASSNATPENSGIRAPMRRSGPSRLMRSYTVCRATSDIPTMT